ncbi:MAG: hypothetical protein LUE64_06525 [Candidatus Gastranaerophilales bacterium]|nr:hypothetical protein [Candidatus Gastranaerophilales bacterium]
MTKDGFQIEENKAQGFIKLYRSFTAWEWYDDVNVYKLYTHCLIKANYNDKKWKGDIVRRGSFITSIGKLSIETGLTIRQIRTALNKLKSTNELTCKTTSRNTIITINNYDLYQADDTQSDKQATNDRQTTDKQATTTKNIKNIKNDKNINKVESLENDARKNFVAKSFFQKLFTIDEEIKKYSSLKDLFIEFLEYKTAIKKQYKTEKSVRNAFLDFVRLSKNDEKYARALVDNSIARGWQSIFDLSKEQKIAFQKAQHENQSMLDDWESRCM